MIVLNILFIKTLVADQEKMCKNIYTNVYF